MPRVWNRRYPDIIPEGAVYVGRPTYWGNPFKVGRDANGTNWTRDQVIDMYETWIRTNHPEMIPEIKAKLRGKDLVCWCAPLRCHADVLLKIANEEE